MKCGLQITGLVILTNMPPDSSHGKEIGNIHRPISTIFMNTLHYLMFLSLLDLQVMYPIHESPTIIGIAIKEPIKG
ncbi:hypothetical protein BSF_40510 [Bacillus subtilis]|nr:hypothetical protein BSF_40510 [Bacillus subtilis]